MRPEEGTVLLLAGSRYGYADLTRGGISPCCSLFATGNESTWLLAHSLAPIPRRSASPHYLILPSRPFSAPAPFSRLFFTHTDTAHRQALLPLLFYFLFLFPRLELSTLCRTLLYSIRLVQENPSKQPVESFRHHFSLSPSVNRNRLMSAVSRLA